MFPPLVLAEILALNLAKTMTNVYLNEDAYYRVLKAFAAGSYDLVRCQLQSPAGRRAATQFIGYVPEVC